MKSSSPRSVDVPFIDLVAQHATLKSEILRIVSDALDSAAFVGGPRLVEFEAEFARFVGSRYAVGLSNGTDALCLALVAFGIGRDDIVLTVPNTFIATTEAISHVGAGFDFIDVDADTCLMDPERLETYLRLHFGNKRISRRVKAIIPVHLYGQCVDMTAVMAIAARYGVRVLEDAAQAHGATHRGNRAGSFGHAAAFSFYAAKNLGACGEAGAVTTQDKKVAQALCMLREHGQKAKYQHSVEGYNARLDAIQAGILRLKLGRLDEWNAARRAIAAFYDSALAPLRWVKPVQVLPGNVPCYHLYVIHIAERDALRAHLAKQGVATGLHYPLPLHLQPCYAHLGYGPGRFPNAERSASQLLSLPMFPELGIERARRVVEAICSFKR